MTISLIAKNTAQNFNKQSIKGRGVVTPRVLYTCPAGKRARIKGEASCDNLGAAANVSLSAGGELVLRWDNTPNANARAEGDYHNAPVGDFLPFDVILDGGENIQFTQDAGTNATTDIFAEVTESPA